MVFGKDSKALALAFGLSSVFSVNAWTYPANPLPKTIDNDGDSLTIRTLGDERYRYTQTVDGYLVVSDSTGIYFYANENGKASKYKAMNEGSRSAEEVYFLRILDVQRAFKKHRERNPDRHKRPADAVKIERSSWVPTSASSSISTEAAADEYERPLLRLPAASPHSNGTNRIPVLLVEDDYTKNLDSSAVYAVLNQENYTQNGYTGSVRDYFVDQSSGKFVPVFDLYFVKVNNTLSSYVGRDYVLVQEAISALRSKYPSFNAANYDSDGDGYVDALPILYAGTEIESGGVGLGGFQYELVWDECGKQDAGGGKFFSMYFLIHQVELMFPTFIHEFSHTMGLRDHYCTNDESCYTDYQSSQYQAPGAHAWDVMATGMYNNEGLTPPNYSAFERNYMGWLDYATVTDDYDVNLLPPLNSSNFALQVKANDDEWYVFENRQKVKWDKYLPNHGMLVWHIDFNQKIWDDNTLNNDPAHQRVDVVEAGNIRVTNYYNGFVSGGSGYMKDDPFPGSQNVTQLSPLNSWSGIQLLPGIFNITEQNSNVCFSTNQSVTVGNCEIATSSSSVVEISSSSEMQSSSSVLAQSSSSENVFESSSSLPESSSAAEITGLTVTEVESSLGMSIVDNVVMLTGIPEEAKITVMDVNGLRVNAKLTQGRNGTALDMSRLGKGIYLVNVRGKFADGKKINRTVKVMRK